MTLELFPKHPEADAYRVGGAYQPYAVVAVDKRFSDAELMAETHRATSLEYAAKAEPSEYKPGTQQRASIQASTLARFALLPHYDE